MREIIELEYRRLKIFQNLKHSEWTNTPTSNELEYLRCIDIELKNKYQKYYRENLFLFLSDSEKLSILNRGNTYFDVTDMTEDELVSYNVYLKMRNFITSDNHMNNNDSSSIYINYINNIRKYLMHHDWLKLKYKLMYIDSNIEEAYLLGNSQDRNTDRGTSKIFNHYEILKRKLLETNSLVKKSFYVKAIVALTNQLSDKYIKNLIDRELRDIQIEYINNNQKYRKMTTINR